MSGLLGSHKEWLVCERTLAVGLMDPVHEMLYGSGQAIGFLRNFEQEHGTVRVDLEDQLNNM